MCPYRPKRASKRWLEGAPEFVLSCHDNGGASTDRYTVYLGGSEALPPLPDYPGYEGTRASNTAISYLSMSGSPTHPQGVSLYGECKALERALFMQTYAGRKCRWLDLPENIREHVVARVQDANKEAA